MSKRCVPSLLLSLRSVAAALPLMMNDQ
jgi:hypothetical protein